MSSPEPKLNNVPKEILDSISYGDVVTVKLKPNPAASQTFDEILERELYDYAAEQAKIANAEIVKWFVENKVAPFPPLPKEGERE